MTGEIVVDSAIFTTRPDCGPPLFHRGDVNDDGVPDVSIGADGLGMSTGGVFTLSGATGELLYSVPVPEGADYFGRR